MHLSTAFDFVAADNLPAAKRQDETIVRAVTRLADFPKLGRVGRIAGTRELVIPGTQYIAAYAVLDGAIAVLAILHGAQRWPVRL
jgi:plasmid stabilization system protein ParE